MDRKGKTKLIMMAVMLVMSVVLLVSASLAWFTLSTAPEVSGMQVTLFSKRDVLISADGEDFTQSIDMSEAFKYYAPLKPVSTVDGVNWFIPEYRNDTSGELLPVEEFILDDTLEHGNVLVYNQSADGTYIDMSENDYLAATNKGYYVYCDFWLKTELEEGCKVTLSAPDLTKNNLESWESNESYEHGAKYGSYALGCYEKGTDEEGKDIIYKIDNNAQTALRVGFLMDKGTDAQRFVIYEPNADKRSNWVDKPYGLESYVHDFYLIENPDYTEESTAEPRFLNYVDNSYIPTKPVGIKMVEGQKVAELKNIEPQNHIVQLAGSWQQNKLQTRIQAGEMPNSNDILYFGKFIKNTASLATNVDGYGNHLFEGDDTMDLASSSLVVELGPEQAKKITMFVWIEGQDADCWNDIASGSFVVNLEFAAQPA